MILLSASFSESTASWRWPIVASVGGIILLWGLWMEQGEEKDWFSSVHDSKRQKTKAKIGRWAVMFGVLVEIGVGFALAAKDEIEERKTAEQIAETSTNLAKIDPLNLPISSVSAQVVLVTNGTNNFNAERLNNPYLVTLEYRRAENMRIPTLFCSDFRYVPGGVEDGTIWYLQFSQKVKITAFLPNSLVRDANEWNVFELDARFVPSGTKILGGNITLKINDTVREIIIPPQMAKNGLDLINFEKNPVPSVSVYGW